MIALILGMMVGISLVVITLGMQENKGRVVAIGTVFLILSLALSYGVLVL